MDLATAKAVISGGASGLGYATAERVIGAGGHVVLLDINEEQGVTSAAELGERAGRKVAIKCRVRGDRLRWLEMARTNAEQGLDLQVASNATIRRQFVALVFSARSAAVSSKLS